MTSSGGTENKYSTSNDNKTASSKASWGEMLRGIRQKRKISRSKLVQLYQEALSEIERGESNRSFWQQLGDIELQHAIVSLSTPDPDWISRVERGQEIKISREMIEALAQALDLSSSEHISLLLAAGDLDTTLPFLSSIELDLVDKSEQEWLSPSAMSLVVAPYVTAIEELQHIVDSMFDRALSKVRIKNISQQSPVQVTLEGATAAVELVKETVVPWRRQHAETIAKLKEKQLEEEIALKQVEILERHARARKDREEASRIAAEADLRRAEAERIRIENQKLQFELQRSYIELVLQLTEQINPGISSADKITYITRLLPVLKALTMSDVQPILSE